MGFILDMSPRSLEKVIYFASYVVTDPGETPLIKETDSYLKKNIEIAVKNMVINFKAGMGAEAVKELLSRY